MATKAEIKAAEAAATVVAAAALGHEVTVSGHDWTTAVCSCGAYRNFTGSDQGQRRSVSAHLARMVREANARKVTA